MENTVNPAMNRLWDTASKDASNSKNNDLSTLLQAKQAADMQAQTAGKPSKKDDVSTSEQGRVMASRSQAFERAYQYSETMSLQLTTKEGDEVTLDFRQMYAEYQSYKEQQQGEQGPQGVRYFESREAMEMTAFEERFAFSVEGDLNEAELAAVFDVFEQVDSLANTFYEGDMEAALQKAMDLDIDYSQLQNMSLNLTQSSVEVTRYKQEAMAQYQQVQNDMEEAEQPANADVADLPPYLQQWQATIERLDEQFQQARAVMDKLMAQVLEGRFPQIEAAEQSTQAADQTAEQTAQPVSEQAEPRMGWYERVQTFHAQLLEMAQANRETASFGAPVNGEVGNEAGGAQASQTGDEPAETAAETVTTSSVETGAETNEETPANPAENPNLATTA